MDGKFHRLELEKNKTKKTHKKQLCISDYTTFTNFSMEYHLMCKVYTDVGGIK